MKRLFDRLIILYTPFLSAFFYVIHTLLLKEGISGLLFYGYNSNFYGHSIFWLYIVLIRSKRMCKWYKLSIKLSMTMNIMNLLYYHKIIERVCLLDIALVLSICSMISWLIFVITKNTTKLFCKRTNINK